MLRIRFKRAGKKNQPSYRLVVSERTRTPFARAKEDIGWYNPYSKEAKIDKERAQYWISVGAQPSDTVHNLFIRQGIIEGKKIAVHSQPKKSEEDVKNEVSAGNEVGEVSDKADPSPDSNEGAGEPAKDNDQAPSTNNQENKDEKADPEQSNPEQADDSNESGSDGAGDSEESASDGAEEVKAEDKSPAPEATNPDLSTTDDSLKPEALKES